MFVNGSTISRSGNANDDRNNSSELNFKTKKNTNQTETVVSSKKNYNTTNRTALTKPELCYNNAKGPLGNKRDAQPKLQNSEDIRKVISDLDLDVDRVDVHTSQLNNHLSPESQRTITELLEKVDRLTALEKLIFYLRLPTGKDAPDPLKLPTNPLGSRFEINQTVNWIRSHLQENSAVSLPKQEVYEEYKVYCVKNTMKPLSTADFGKVMKQVFPDVRPRRLGTRGNSRYCYAGLCKMAHLPVPELPLLQDKPETRNGNSSCAMKSTMCSWLEKVMGRKFKSFEEIGKHFLSLGKTDLSAPCEHKYSATVPPNCLRAKSTERNSPVKKHQESSLKSKHTTQETSCMSLESTRVKKTPHISAGKGKRKTPNVLIKKRPLSNSLNENTTGKKLKTSNRQRESIESVCDINNRKSLKEDFLLNGKNLSVKISEDLIPDKSTKKPFVQRIKRFLGSDILLNNVNTDVKDNLNVNSVSENELGEKMVFSPVQETKDTHTLQIGSKIQIPRIIRKCGNNPAPANLIVLPTLVTSSPSPIRQYKPIKPSPLKEKLNTTTRTSNDILGKHFIIRKQGSLQGDKNDNQVGIGFLENDVLDDYLHGDGNSQEQEEELLKYFQPQNPLVATPVEKKVHPETLSQLRSLLEKNMNTVARDKVQSLNLQITDDLPSVTSTVIDNLSAGTSTNIQENVAFQDVGASTGMTKPQDQRAIVFPSLIIADPNLNSRRRVSFENLPVSVPQSPNTRRKVFNFTPISPTKTKYVCESPFVSPRDTQVPRLKQQTVSIPPSNKKSLLNHTSGLKSPSPSANVQLRTILNSDSVKRSGTKSKHSVLPVQHKIFLLPCSSVSVGEPQIFHIKENVQSPKQLECKTEEKLPNSSQVPSLLQSILTYGKYKPKTDTQEHEETKNCTNSVVSNFYVSDPLSQEVSKFFPEGGIPESIEQPQTGYRSHSVPVLSSSALISPLSTTQPFLMFYSTPNEFDSSVEATPVPSEITDFGSVINAESSSSNFLLMTDENDVQNFEDYEVPEQNDLLIHSAMNKIFEMMTDGSKAPILEIDENEKCQQPSRSYPNTPVPYCTSFENNSRDPIVSAFAPKPPIPNQQGSRSYPSTPVFSSQLLNTSGSLLNSTSTVRRNINLLLPDSSSSLGLLTKEEEETLSLQLPGCEDTFNVLAAVVADDVGGDSDL